MFISGRSNQSTEATSSFTVGTMDKCTFLGNYQYFLLSKCRKFPATISLNNFFKLQFGLGFFFGGGCQSSFKNPCNYFYDLLIIFL